MNADSNLEKIVISDEDFQKFREYFYRKTGVNFEPTKRYFVDKRLVDRIEATNCDNFRSYFTRLRFDASSKELQQLTNLMVVTETYFAREEYQFQCMVDSMMPEIIKRKTDRNPIRIWSMGSASGEEPYTIVMYLLELWAGINDWDVEVIASDIDTDMLHKARVGRYSARSVQHLPALWLAKYFTRMGGEYQICETLRQSVEFTHVNLMETADTWSYRNFDIVFCRNLLIYFDDVSRKAAAETLYEAMNPGGYICLGHSESMSRISSLYNVRKFSEAIVYQKPLETQ